MEGNWYENKAKRFTIFASAFVIAIVSLGYLSDGARATKRVYKHAVLVWQMPNMVPKMAKQVDTLLIIFEHEFGTVSEEGEYRRNGRHEQD